MGNDETMPSWTTQPGDAKRPVAYSDLLRGECDARSTVAVVVHIYKLVGRQHGADGSTCWLIVGRLVCGRL